MKIIVTGFEPFGGAEKNASWEAVKNLEGAERVLLPVSFAEANRIVRSLAASGPDLILCVGEAGGRDKISLERIAVNLQDARIPDNDGFQPRDLPVREGGPAAYFSALPLRPLLSALEARGIPAELSCTAGTYVCNTVFYALMDELSLRGLSCPAGFLHVPARDMDPARIQTGLKEVLRVAQAGVSW